MPPPPLAHRFAAHAAALVTGAASGIGAACARRLSQDGVRRMLLVDRDAAGLDAIAHALSAQGIEVLARAHDVADPAAWAVTEAAARDRFTTLSLVVANAGVTGAAPIVDTDFGEWRRILSVNLDGAFLTLRTGLRLATPGHGAMVVVSSASGLKAAPGVAAYGASKAAVLQLMRVAALEGARLGVRVNAVTPGGVATPMWRETDMFRDLLETHAGDEAAAFATLGGNAAPLGRFASADEIAGIIAFLLSDESGVITGSALACDGGYAV